MTIQELKESILNNTLDDKLLIMCCSESKIIGMQYLEAIIKNKELSVQYVDSLNSLSSTFNQFDIFSTEDIAKPLYVLITSELNKEHIDSGVDLSQIKNCIVVCTSINKAIKNFTNDYVVTVPKLEERQIKDYMYQKADGINENIVNWLCKVSNNNIDRIDKELTKLQLFPKEDRVGLFNLMYKENAFEDLTPTSVFDLTTAILKQDISSVKSMLKNIRYTDIEGITLNTILRRNVKNIIDIQMSSKSTADSVGISAKQYTAIKYNYVNRYSDSVWINLFDFLTNVDINLKMGKLDLKGNQFIEYIVLNSLRIMRG